MGLVDGSGAFCGEWMRGCGGVRAYARRLAQRVGDCYLFGFRLCTLADSAFVPLSREVSKNNQAARPPSPYDKIAW